MAMTDSRKELVGEIFRLTGQKVDIDDPVVVAALINAQLIRQAGEDAMFSIQSALDQVIGDLSTAVNEERKAAADISKATDLAYQKIISMTKAAAQSEVVKMRQQFSEVVTEILERVRREAGEQAPSEWKIKFGILALSVMLLSGAAGLAVGMTWFNKVRPTALQAQQLSMGKTLMELLPKMDKATKEKLLHQLEKNMH